MGSRYDKGTDDYVNCPMNQEEYDAFWKELTTAQEAEVHGFEDSQVFEGCMPVEVMARRGHDTLLYGPLKSRGLDDPRTGRWPYAVVQLRRDNADGTVYNLVGFQTHLKFPEQRRVFSMIPALRNAEFLRYGVMHRNTFLDSPRLLDRYYRLKKEPRIAFAGQMTGVEGYVESAASGFLVGIETARRLKGQPPVDFPREMAVGALALYISNESVTQFQPMNINFGIIPPLDHFVKGKRNKNAEISQRANLPFWRRKKRPTFWPDHPQHRRVNLPAGKPDGGRPPERRNLPMKIILDAMGGDNAPSGGGTGRFGGPCPVRRGHRAGGPWRPSGPA